MQILKAAVIAMGVLILAGFGLLIYGFATQLDKGEVDGSPRLPISQADAPQGFGEVSAGLQAREIVLESMTDAGRLLLRTRLPDGREQIRFYDIQTGKQVGTLSLSPAQP